MASGPRTSKPATKQDADRRQLLVHIEADRVKKLKKAAIDLERSASDIVEEAVQAWLEKFEKRKA
jgi:ribbon-helix-helix CopG family protein